MNDFIYLKLFHLTGRFLLFCFCWFRFLCVSLLPLLLFILSACGAGDWTRASYKLQRPSTADLSLSFICTSPWCLNSTASSMSRSRKSCLLTISCAHCVYTGPPQRNWSLQVNTVTQCFILKCRSQVWQCTPVIPGLRILRQEDRHKFQASPGYIKEFKASLHYMERPCLRTN